MNLLLPPPRLLKPGIEWPLFDTATTRVIERAGLVASTAHALMQRAGLAAARLALALHPHTQVIWIAAGPGNNGGDGMEAGMHLHNWGKQVVVTWLGDEATAPADAAASYRRAKRAGVPFADAPADHWDLCIDALLGIGATRAPDGTMAQWIGRIGQSAAPVLSIDIPTGLHADTGVAAPCSVKASATLCLLALKPGLFTADGRDASQQVWLDDLQLDAATCVPQAAPAAWLIAAPQARLRPHASHKGSYGDVAIVGGASGMAGAVVLAGLGALHSGAGRVYVCQLDEHTVSGSGTWAPELMQRTLHQLDLRSMSVVCGCGGGDAVRACLPQLLSGAPRLVLDADALNALASDPQLQTQLRARIRRAFGTVLTPHPLEAARLLGAAASQVQSDRLRAAQQLADDYQCVVALKGSGTVVAMPGRAPGINPTGNARLAVAGSGDVLAGMIGAGLAAGQVPFDAACGAVYRHGAAADRWPGDAHLTAMELARSL